MGRALVDPEPPRVTRRSSAFRLPHLASNRKNTWDGDDMPPRILIGGSLYLAGAVLAENGTPPV